MSDAHSSASSSDVAPQNLTICEAIIEQFGLTADIYADLHEYFREADHVDWYWKLLDSSQLTHEQAYTMSVAMHADGNLKFDEATCLETPYSPWTLQ